MPSHDSSQNLPARPSENPLMQPVPYNGHTYCTSQYFHALYLQEHSVSPKKYRQHGAFLKLVRSIESYPLYLERGDVVVMNTTLAKNSVDTGGNPLWISWNPLFKATNNNPITLINAAFQAQLMNHLDDELSKQMAYAQSVKLARDESAPGVSTLRQVEDDVETYLRLCALFETPKYMALIEAAKYVKKVHQIDLSPMLQVSAALDAIPDEQVMLEPTEIGKRMGISGADLNKRLQRTGLQARIGGEWVPTDAGKEHAYRHAWHVGEKSGFNLKWNVDFVLAALKEEN